MNDAWIERTHVRIASMRVARRRSVALSSEMDVDITA